MSLFPKRQPEVDKLLELVKDDLRFKAELLLVLKRIADALETVELKSILDISKD